MTFTRIAHIGMCWVLLHALPAAAQPVTIARDTGLRAEPDFASPIVASVKRTEKAEVGAKQGPWLRVKLIGRQGWLLTTEVAYASAGTPRRLGPTTTIGIRGPGPSDPNDEHNDPGGMNKRAQEQLRLLDEYAKPYEEIARPIIPPSAAP